MALARARRRARRSDPVRAVAGMAGAVLPAVVLGMQAAGVAAGGVAGLKRRMGTGVALGMVVVVTVMVVVGLDWGWGGECGRDGVSEG